MQLAKSQFSKPRRSKMWVYGIFCAGLIGLSFIGNGILSAKTDQLRQLSAQEAAQREVSRAAEEAIIEAMNIRSISDISSTTLEKLIQYTNDDAVSRSAIPEDAIYKICITALQNKYGSIKSTTEGMHPYDSSYSIDYWLTTGVTDTSNWISPQVSMSVDSPNLYSAFLFQSKDNEDKGILRLVYKLHLDADFAGRVMVPGNFSQLSEDVYFSYTYYLDLSNKDLPITDYNSYEFDGKDKADLDYDNWCNKNKSAYLDDWLVLDEIQY